MKNMLIAVALLAAVFAFMPMATAENPFESQRYVMGESGLTEPVYSQLPSDTSAYYWVWRDRAGWHLRVTTDGLLHRFRGSVELSEGAIQHFSTIGLKWRGDKAWVEEGNKIGFDMAVHGGIQGFDWQTDSKCNEFNLYLDNKLQAKKIFLGDPANTPDSASFEICQLTE